MNGQPLNQEQILLIAVLILAILVAVLLSATIIALVKVSSLTKKYNAFMKGSDLISTTTSISRCNDGIQTKNI